MPELRPITLLQPPRIAFGAGCARECADELARQQRRHAAVVATERSLGQAAPLLDALRAKGIAVTPLTGVPPEPDVASFDRARERLAGVDIDSVIGLGGGSVLDIAKLLAVLHGRNDPVQQFYGVGLLPPRHLYLACLPTTAGAGSEVSPNAVVLDEVAQLKKGLVSPWLVPDAAFVDPTLTLSLPPALTASTGLDALVHCIEAYANLAAHPVVDVYALEGIRLIGANILRAVRHGADLEARSAVALGSLYGGLCLGPVNTAAVHALAYPLGGEFRLAHGVTNAILLPHVLRFNLPAMPRRYAEIARALGVPPAADDLAIATLGIERLAQLSADCGLPSGLGALGVPAEAIPRLAAGALTVTRILKNNPRPVTHDDAMRIYQAAF